jgi:hypothetical protein
MIVQIVNLYFQTPAIYEDYCRLGSDTVWSGRLLQMLQRNIKYTKYVKSTRLQNANDLPNYTASHPRGQQSSQLPLW